MVLHSWTKTNFWQLFIHFCPQWSVNGSFTRAFERFFQRFQSNDKNLSELQDFHNFRLFSLAKNTPVNGFEKIFWVSWFWENYKSGNTGWPNKFCINSVLSSKFSHSFFWNVTIFFKRDRRIALLYATIFFHQEPLPKL